MTVAIGGCLCGKVRFSARDVEHQHHACHCQMCRRWTGGPAFAARVGSIDFDGQESPKNYASSKWAERGFCNHCGTSLYYHLRGDDIYYVNVGAFDDAELFQLVGEIYVDAQPSGYRFAGDLQRLTEAEVMSLHKDPAN